ncbi:nose resistant to fluoxetine protein 6-like isoform X2 [Musca autumnalis]|uniref:nose resistant to fluoxetine protein 6-like isoform X2 n=1 Tax=Musca autumnalis TaxID=221902 RepID=UPI003CF66668
MFLRISVKFLLALSVFLSVQGYALSGQVEYSRHDLPPLYTFDNYDRCLDLGVDTKLASTYCMVYAEVQQDNSSELWHKIATHKENKFHYRHDRLYFGVCLEKCRRYLEESADEGNISYSHDTTLNKEIIQFIEDVHKRPLDLEMRSKYGLAIQNCLNDEFQEKYDGLQLNTFVEYCERKVYRNNSTAKDPAEIILYKFLKIVLLLALMSSIYDYVLRSSQTEENQTNEFYKNNLDQPLSRLLTSFSICRNYYRLIQPYRGEIGIDFSYLDGFRSVCTLMVLHGHTFYLHFQHTGNPEYFERFGNSTHGLMTLNSSTIIEIFMVMSGLLLYVKFTAGGYVTPQTSWRKCIKTYLFIVISRLMRFLPSVALLIWINATVLTNLNDGPFWRHISEPSRIFSRENWWKNIFMINNFSLKDTVSTHTWYLAADFQLLAFYTLVLIFISKYPQYKKRVLYTLAILAVVIPTLISYILKLESAFIIKPESYRYQFFIDSDVFYYLYSLPFTNLGGYLFGIWCGDLYLKYLRTEELRRKVRGNLKFELSGWLAVPIAAGICYVGSRAILQEPSIWTALYGGLYRNLWIAFVCGLPLLGMACKCGYTAYDFCRLPIFRILARLSFQMYLWHVMILQLLNGYQRKPFHMNSWYFNAQGFLTIVFSLIVAFFACLLIEYPFAQFFDALQTRGGKARNGATIVPKEAKVQ